MADLIAFVEEQTLIVDDSLFSSNNAVEQYLDRTDKSSKIYLFIYLFFIYSWQAKYFVTLTEEKHNMKQV